MSSSNVVRLATTTSANDTGLLGALKTAFESSNPTYTLEIIPLGSGQALDLAVNHGADVTLTHSPVREGELLTCHILKCRKHIFYNQFVFVGGGDGYLPSGTGTPLIGLDWLLKKCFKAIAKNPSLEFVSRNDDSGTNARENEIWEALGIDPDILPNIDRLYPCEPSGMLAALEYTNSLAAIEPAFTLSDDGTYYKFELIKGVSNKLSIRSHVVVPPSTELPDPWALNQYSVSLVNPCVAQGNFAGAEAFFSWMFGDEARDIIEAFTGGTPHVLFNYNADQEEPDSPFLRMLYRLRQQRIKR